MGVGADKAPRQASPTAACVAPATEIVAAKHADRCCPYCWGARKPEGGSAAAAGGVLHGSGAMGG